MKPPGSLRSLRARVALAAVSALAASLLVAGLLLVSAIERDGRRTVDEELTERAAALTGPRGGPGRRFGRGFGGDGLSREERGGGLLAGSGTFVRVVLDGEVVQQRGDAPAAAAPLPTRDGYRTHEVAVTPWRSLAVPVPGFTGARVELLQSLAGVQARVADIRRLVLVFGLAALGLCAFAAWGATSLALRPLGRLRGAAARVSGTEDLSARLPREGGDPTEVAALTDSLNAMLGRLEESARAQEGAFEATRRFAADAGHELRTPLTGLRANLDALLRNPDLADADRRDALLEMRTEQGRMLALLEGLQALARGEAPEALRREPVELGDLVDAAVHAARVRHPGTDFAFGSEGVEDRTEGWPDGLRMLVDNLLTNAAVHGRPGGSVEVALGAPSTGGLELLVDDDGPGLAPEERARVLEPFVRGRGTRAPGTGLGLAVVAQQVALHRGELHLESSPHGGLRVRVGLPASAGAPPPQTAPAPSTPLPAG